MRTVRLSGSLRPDPRRLKGSDEEDDVNKNE